MMFRRRPIEPTRMAVLVVILWALAGLPAQAQSQGQLFATVVDSAGQPVTDMRPEEFVVQEDGVPCPVVAAQVGTTPMKIALLVDNGDGLRSGGALNPLRTGLSQFLDTLPPEHEVGLYTLARNVQQQVEFTTDRGALRESVESIFPDQGAGAVVFDGISETWNRRFTEDDSWPVFVLVLTGGADISRNVSDTEYGGLINTLIGRAVTVHAVVRSGRGSDFAGQISNDFTESTGGEYRSFNSPTALPDLLTDVATEMIEHFDEMSGRYRLVYERPTDEPGQQIAAGVARPGVTMQLYADRRRAEE